MTTAVDAVFLGKERRFNRRFLRMCSHYLVDPVACTPASGWEKGQVENQVGNIREHLFTPRLHFASYAEINAWLEARSSPRRGRARIPSRPTRPFGKSSRPERPSPISYPGPFDKKGLKRPQKRPKPTRRPRSRSAAVTARAEGRDEPRCGRRRPGSALYAPGHNPSADGGVDVQQRVTDPVGFRWLG